MMTFLFATLWEAGRHAVNVAPGIAEYLPRTYNGCGEAAFSLLDVAAGHEVPERLCDAPAQVLGFYAMPSSPSRRKRRSRA